MPKLADGEQSHGHTCPRCKVRLRVRRVTHKPGQVVERVKRCPRCPFQRVFVDAPKGARPRAA